MCHGVMVHDAADVNVSGEYHAPCQEVRWLQYILRSLEVGCRDGYEQRSTPHPPSARQERYVYVGFLSIPPARSSQSTCT
jgi:hypothetical protein